MSENLRQITLMKGNEGFIFRYEVGREEELLDSFLEYASNPNINFDWFDAAVLSYQLGRKMGNEERKLSGQVNNGR
ncbi:hypothetical protein HYV50_02120 [Candidatus Pacearchaeota archaeon]|nr:hypothetical protein [Candidatus Pacearchaeota archaeon]